MPSVERASVGAASAGDQTVATALMYVQMNPPPGAEAAFNIWYDKHAAARLGMKRTTLQSRIRKLNIARQYR